MLRTFTRALARTQMPQRPLASMHRRNYAQDSKKDAQKSSNLLDDDMIARAGLDPENVEGKQSSTSGSASEGANASSNAGEGAGEGAGADGEGKKWESTARAPRSESRQVEKRTRRAWIGTGLFLGGVVAYLARPFDDEEKLKHTDIKSEGWDPANAWNRVRGRYFTTVDTFAAPVFDKLLPDPLPAPYDRPTLVISVDDFLIKSEWSRKHGWRVAKRPGVDYFLGYLAQYYEIVLFSDKYQAMAAETILKLDPLRASVSYALFREATRYDKGTLVKDLNHLNRDLRKVIVLEVDPDAIKLQPENALVFPEWDGKPGDQDLVRLIPLLEWIGAQPIKDVRPVLKSYQNSPDGVLNEYERRDRINREKWAQKQQQGGSKSINSLLGLGSTSNNDMMPQDVVRVESQKNYARFRKHVEEYGKKLAEEEEQKMKDALNDHKMTLNKWLSGDTPSPEQLSQTVAEKDAGSESASK